LSPAGDAAGVVGHREDVVSVSANTAQDGGAPPPAEKKDRTHYLYIAVIVAVVAGVAVGLIWPALGVALRPIGTAFVNLIKMIISPVIFCTIVLGIGSIREAAKVGKVGSLALLYFVVMSTFALIIGLVVGNLLQPGAGLIITPGGGPAATEEAQTTTEFLLGIIPTTLVSPLVGEMVLQTLFVALLIGFAIQGLGKSGQAVLRGVKHFERVVFRVLAMIMWVAPIGAFGAIAAVVGATGWSAIAALGQIMLGFYLTCALFIVVVLGALLKLFTGMGIFSLLKYLAREYLLIVATSSSEAALPRLVAKMEHLGISRPVVGIVVPTGYSFNLDGTAIYLTMASLFIAEAMGTPLTLPEQISLLVFMMIASKGAAGVTGAGLAVLSGGLASHRPDLVDGVGLIVGIDRFMSEARAVTNFSGNAVATVLIGKWVGEFDQEQARRTLSGEDPFDEATMIDDDEPPPLAEHATAGHDEEGHRVGGDGHPVTVGGHARDDAPPTADGPDPDRAPRS
jgi:aerobic C4-dicarboxylate transport protein